MVYTVYNHTTLAMFFFYFAPLKIHVVSKILEPTTFTEQVIKKKSANVQMQLKSLLS